MPSRAGYSYLLLALMVTVVLFTAALRLRSWPLWLAAFGLTVCTLVVAWIVRGTYVVAP